MIKKSYVSLSSQNTYQSLKEDIRIQCQGMDPSHWLLKYPLTIYSDDCLKAHTFLQGSVEITKATMAAIEANEKYDYFIMTRADGIRVYCVAYSYYQKSFLKQEINGRLYFQEYYLPTSLMLYSLKQYFKLMTNLLRIFKQLRKNNPSLPKGIDQAQVSRYQQYINNNIQQYWDRNQIPSMNPNTTKKLPFENIFKYYLDIGNLCNFGNKMYINMNNNLQILHLYQIKDSLYKFTHFVTNPLSGETLVKTLVMILSEKMILFVSNNPNSNIIAIETLMQMLIPLKWNFMYVPNMTQSLIDAVNESFQPFIVGITYQMLPKVDRLDDKVIVYTNENKIIVPDEDLKIDLPQILGSYFKGVSNYLPMRGNSVEWQKDLRIKSLMFMTSFLNYCQSILKVMASDNKKTSINMVMKYRFSYPKLHHILSDFNYHIESYKFIEKFVKESAFFSNYISTNKLQDPKLVQIQELLRMNTIPRYEFIKSKFNKLQFQVQHPPVYDNEKQWVKYWWNQKRISNYLGQVQFSQNIFKRRSTMNYQNIPSQPALTFKESSINKYYRNESVGSLSIKDSIVYPKSSTNITNSHIESEISLNQFSNIVNQKSMRGSTMEFNEKNRQKYLSLLSNRSNRPFHQPILLSSTTRSITQKYPLNKRFKFEEKILETETQRPQDSYHDPYHDSKNHCFQSTQTTKSIIINTRFVTQPNNTHKKSSFPSYFMNRR